MLIGAGGVGCPLAITLANVCKRLVIVDHDRYERHNMHRQPLAIGREDMLKVECLVVALKPWTPNEIIPLGVKFEEGNREQLMADFNPDLIVVAVDNKEAREAIWPLRETRDILWGANELWMPQAGISLKEKPWNPMEAFTPAEESGVPICGQQTIHANVAAAAMASTMLMMHMVDHEDKNVPVFISKQTGTPVFTMQREDL